MGRACSTNGEKRNAYRILAGKPEGKRPLGRLTHRRGDNIRMDLKRPIQLGSCFRNLVTQLGSSSFPHTHKCE
jgi:hypothetical protein